MLFNQSIKHALFRKISEQKKTHNKRSAENLQLSQLENDLVSKKDIYPILLPNTVT